VVKTAGERRAFVKIMTPFWTGMGLHAESELFRDRTCCILSYICDFLGVRHID
jgi:hypothetical protein